MSSVKGSPAEPFDRVARRQRRARAAPGFAAHAFLKRAVTADIAERVAAFGRVFECGLDLGCHDARVDTGAGWTVALDPALAFARAAGIPAVVADEDRLPFGDGSFDIIVSALALHGVNDLPGALIQARRALRPGGVFIAALFGAASLSDVRAELLAAEDEATGRAAARVSPMVDVQAAAGLLQRAGFAMPVADVATLTVHYRDAARALADLHGMAEGNILATREPLRRAVLADAVRRFEARRAPDGRIAVAIDIVTLTGFAPSGLPDAALGEAMRARV